VVYRHNPPHAGAKPVPTTRLTDLSLLNFKASRTHTDYWDATLPTFGVRISPKGTKTFVLKLRNARRALGRYPIISLQEARTEAKRLLAERTLGKIRPQSITYPQAVKLFTEDKKRSRRAKTAESYEWMLNRFTFKGQLSEITGDDIARTLKGINSRSTYDHALVAARIFFNWAMKRRYVEHNPTFGLSPHGTPTRSRVLTDAELKSIWRACSTEPANAGEAPSRETSASLPRAFATIVKLLILTGQRRGEITALRISWIQDDTITLPKEITKNGREHTFPIGNITSTLLTGLSKECTLIFPARGKPSTPFTGWSKSKAALDELSGITNWTLHDLRRTFATNLAQMAVAPHVIERLLNHVTGTISGVTAVYNRATYMSEMREAVALWEIHLKQLLNLT
jgi:integrase